MKRRRLDRTDLGQLLRRFRRTRGVSQEKLAEQAGLHRTYISHVELGTRNPSFEVVDMLLVALGVSWEEFGRELDRTAFP